MSIDEEWNNFLDNIENINETRLTNYEDKIPKCSDIYISTKTKIIYLNKNLLDIYSIFWKIQIEDYDKQIEGIIKKQIKISCNTKEELSELEDLIKKESYSYNISKSIKHIDNPNGRIKFKDVRKISVGLSKKDIIYRRTKEKSAFYNCFVITIRILYNNIFKEIHVKIFNTGKLEIPGIQTDKILEIVLDKLLELLSKIVNEELKILPEKTENVLINSNFNCGFYINREILFDILRQKYNINASYDPCSYPGIRCEYYYDNLNNVKISNNLNLYKNLKTKEDKQQISKISFMIFRTGSILIVGKCSEYVLKIVYEYVKNILLNEFREIMVKIIDNNNEKKQNCPSKIRKRTIYIK
tara:strand:- start:7105 stop:8172 length:1068 start_codon:yes stop_codon:yes gene_type:complete